MTLLDSHLEQISSSAKTIGDLEFPPPKLFTNAILGKHEITTLIRDTEPHERALFSVDHNVAGGLITGTSRRQTTLGGADTNNRRKTINPTQRQSSAVAKVLGNDMLRQIQQSTRARGKSNGINVEVLLQGAERLCAVYAVAGAQERITSLRSRHRVIAKSIVQYEEKISKQQARLSRQNLSTDYDADLADEGVEHTAVTEDATQAFTEEDMRAEEEEIRELEARKKALEDRVAGMEKDLGGLLR